MKKILRFVCSLMIVCCILLMGGVIYGFFVLPDEISSLSEEKIDIGLFYSCDVDKTEKMASKSLVTEGKYSVSVKLFNSIPVKKSNLTVKGRPYVVPSGEIVGLRLFSKGVMIVGSDKVQTESGELNPMKDAGLSEGDVITCVDNTEVASSLQLESIIRKSGGKVLEIRYTRNGKSLLTSLKPALCKNENVYKAGMWIRDSAAGIGTMTFYEKDSGFFVCLGHAVCDIDTGKVLPLSDGDIVDARINGCVKGKIGAAGELCGVFTGESEGALFLNEETGVYGILLETDKTEKEIPIAAKSEVKTGKAQIISTVEGESKAYYDIEIEKLNPDGKDSKNMVIKITDSKLLEKTGGIVQGMSGSPILQDGYLVGAVTHVFVNDPTRGYGIFAQTMLEKSEGAEMGKAG